MNVLGEKEGTKKGMEKINVIIAEDEPPIARFIKMLTEQEKDFLVTAICENGEDALKEVESSSARLLITDIRMLGMDGLELIRRIRQKNQEIRVLIISGYKMFEYAREAIRLGIEDYITKPIEPEEFTGALDRVRRYYARENRLERQLRLEKALKNKDGKAWAENAPGKFLEVMSIYQSGDANENIPLHVRMMEDIYILNYKDSLLYLRCPEEADKVKRKAFSTSDFESAKEDMEYKNGKTASRLRKIMDLQHGRTVSGVLIREMETGEENIRQIGELYRHVRKLAVPGQKVTEEYKNITMLKPVRGMAGDKLLKKIKMDMEANSRKQFMEDFRKLFDGWEKEKAAVYQMKSALYEMADGLNRAGWLHGESMALKEYIDDSIHYSDSYEEIRENLYGFLEESIKEGGEGGRNGKEARILFEEICELIEKRTDRNYSLAEISIRFGVSQPYVRKVFKTFAGVTYNEYVLKEKIEIAKRLMELNPYMMIKDVADAIGFEQLYFSTVFSKREGMSPSKYKLICS